MDTVLLVTCEGMEELEYFGSFHILVPCFYTSTRRRADFQLRSDVPKDAFGLCCEILNCGRPLAIINTYVVVSRNTAVNQACFAGFNASLPDELQPRSTACLQAQYETQPRCAPRASTSDARDAVPDAPADSRPPSLLESPPVNNAVTSYWRGGLVR